MRAACCSRTCLLLLLFLAPCTAVARDAAGEPPAPKGAQGGGATEDARTQASGHAAEGQAFGNATAQAPPPRRDGRAEPPPGPLSFVDRSPRESRASVTAVEAALLERNASGTVRAGATKNQTDTDDNGVWSSLSVVLVRRCRPKPATTNPPCHTSANPPPPLPSLDSSAETYNQATAPVVLMLLICVCMPVVWQFHEARRRQVERNALILSAVWEILWLSRDVEARLGTELPTRLASIHSMPDPSPSSVHAVDVAGPSRLVALSVV